MSNTACQGPRTYNDHIARALTTPGGHLAIGRGGATLYFGNGWRSGCDEEQIKAECIEAGLPVIDSRSVPFEVVCDLAVRGPMIAVGKAPDPEPWALSRARPLAVVAEVHRAAGAEVFNLDPPGAATRH